MQTEKKDFVSFQYLYTSDEKHACDSAEKAVEALNELGMCMNWAVVNKISKSKPSICALFYEGWVFRSTPERYVELPFDKNSQNFHQLFAELLKSIFEPFWLNESIHRSIIIVQPKDKDCFFVSLYILFDDKTGYVYENISNALKNVSDECAETEAKVFWLD